MAYELQDEELSLHLALLCRILLGLLGVEGIGSLEGVHGFQSLLLGCRKGRKAGIKVGYVLLDASDFVEQALRQVILDHFLIATFFAIILLNSYQSI